MFDRLEVYVICMPFQIQFIADLMLPKHRFYTTDSYRANFDSLNVASISIRCSHFQLIARLMIAQRLEKFACLSGKRQIQCR